LGERRGGMCTSGIFNTTPAIKAYLKRSGLEPNLLQSVYRNSFLYGLSIGDKSGDISWPLFYVVKVMFSVLVSELITQEQIAVGASNLLEGLIMSPAMYEHWPRLKRQRSRSPGHVFYQHQERYDWAMDGRINVKSGGDFRREGQDIRKGCSRCKGAESAFSAVHTVNVMASKCSVSRGNGISIWDYYYYYLKMLALCSSQLTRQHKGLPTEFTNCCNSV